jgi:hypothetical protein
MAGEGTAGGRSRAHPAGDAPSFWERIAREEPRRAPSGSSRASLFGPAFIEANSRESGVRSYGGSLIAVVAVGSSVLGGCAGGDAESLEDVLGAVPTPIEESEPPAHEDEPDDGEDVAGEVDLEAFAPPDEIDEAYVLSVLDAMHEGFLPALRDAVTAGEVTPELEAALADIYVEDRVEHAVGGWEIRIAAELDGQALRELAPSPAPREHVGFREQMLSDECVVGILEVDEAPWFGGDSTGVSDRDLVLVPAEPAPPVNPTPWRIAFDGVDGPGVEAC